MSLGHAAEFAFPTAVRQRMVDMELSGIGPPSPGLGCSEVHIARRAGWVVGVKHDPDWIILAMGGGDRRRYPLASQVCQGPIHELCGKRVVLADQTVAHPLPDNPP